VQCTNKDECNRDQELAGAAAHARGRRFVFTRLVAAHHFLVWNDVMAAILKVWCQIEIPTPSVDAYLHEEITPNNIPIQNDGTLGFFRRGEAPNKDNNSNNKKMSSDMRSVPDLTRTNVLWIRNCRQKCQQAVGERCYMRRGTDATRALTRWQHFGPWNDVMVAILKVWRQIKNPLPQVMGIYLKNKLAKFHPDQIWNDGALGFFNEHRPNNSKMNSGIGSVLIQKSPGLICPSVLQNAHQVYVHGWYATHESTYR